MKAISLKTSGRFSPRDEITCCIPPGSSVSTRTRESACCSGKIAQIENEQRCCLEDYTNITIFFNRYVSSMLQHLPNNRFDPFTGRPIYREEVGKIALQLNACCSGKIASGQALSSPASSHCSRQHNPNYQICSREWKRGQCPKPGHSLRLWTTLEHRYLLCPLT